MWSSRRTTFPCLLSHKGDKLVAVASFRGSLSRPNAVDSPRTRQVCSLYPKADILVRECARPLTLTAVARGAHGGSQPCSAGAAFPRELRRLVRRHLTARRRRSRLKNDGNDAIE